MAVHKVLAGHGATRPSYGADITIPKNIVLHFYVAHGASLPNSIGKKVDAIVRDGPGGVTPVQTLRQGDKTYPYRLYNHKGGGYLNLGMSPQANPNFIRWPGPGGKPLIDLLNEIRRSTDGEVHVHWSACRSVESDSDPEDFPEDAPKKLDLSKAKVREDTDFKRNLAALVGPGVVPLSSPIPSLNMPATLPAALPDTVHKKHGLFCKMKQFLTGKKK
jgi:hypothetical protein